ncbi:phosphatase PAP2 family protein [Cryobacterium sp. PH31-O1]|uniref:phosphatase PAP2 family protein n=1 Tax=Cryobacterium sp. PH31-O1 TaxID=3046306 RepID=UPI0024BBBB6E|nr:phosphatase PAP2 family protein [Cryobacterium sp. PH31-O1]MDJ0338050.1 phosphatase PAP2 family protein [Cryobacterium sp. PH31-O1]
MNTVACLTVRNWSPRNSLPKGSLGYLAGAALIVVVFIGLYLFFVRSHVGQEADQLAYDGAEFGRRSITPFTGRVLDSVPDVAVAFGVLLTAVIAFVRRNWRTLGVALVAAAAATASAQLLKYGILARPDLGVEGYAGNSFPSGHTTVAAASALAVFLVASPRLRPMVAGWGTAFAVLAGVATLANQWHRPSDVIAALLWVALWGCIAGAVLAWPGVGVVPRTAAAAANSRWPAFTGLRRSTVRIIRWLSIGCGTVSSLAFIATLVVNSSLFDSVGTVGTLVAYLGGVAAIVTAGLLLALSGTRMFARLP